MRCCCLALSLGADLLRWCLDLFWPLLEIDLWYDVDSAVHAEGGDVGLLAFHPHFKCGWHGFDLLETAVLALEKYNACLLILVLSVACLGPMAMTMLSLCRLP
ncbi:hypothetical protein Nepgr_006563 [Nepenthes gracilis]|uniref:Uncharacterized protein n=1 Tax=Nepenthes gracilis TaxID=150966 RepID=A0AAD3XHH5_NEPGR|nr:hypothetical protein Nepgr_006563 [Nepenthes gracilis]